MSLAQLFSPLDCFPEGRSVLRYYKSDSVPPFLWLNMAHALLGLSFFLDYKQTNQHERGLLIFFDCHFHFKALQYSILSTILPLLKNKNKIRIPTTSQTHGQ